MEEGSGGFANRSLVMLLRRRPMGAALPSTAMGLQDALAFADDDGEEVVLDAEEADTLLALTGGLDAATVSACPQCRSRVLACVALADLLEDAPPHPRANEIRALADDAPTLHVYVQDLKTECTHTKWRDPGAAEWADALDDVLDDPPALR